MENHAASAKALRSGGLQTSATEFYGSLGVRSYQALVAAELQRRELDLGKAESFPLLTTNHEPATPCDDTNLTNGAEEHRHVMRQGNLLPLATDIPPGEFISA